MKDPTIYVQKWEDRSIGSLHYKLANFIFALLRDFFTDKTDC